MEFDGEPIEAAAMVAYTYQTCYILGVEEKDLPRGAQWTHLPERTKTLWMAMMAKAYGAYWAQRAHLEEKATRGGVHE